ncbi:MAG: acyl-CoA dehydrogenase family protein [Acidimicrobiales bacterium]
MDLELTAEQGALRDVLRSVLEAQCPVSLARSIVESDVEGIASRDGRIQTTVAGELWARMAELDWPALTVPRPYGGVGLGTVELAVMSEELGRALAPGPLAATVSQFVPAVVGGGNDAQRHRFLQPVAREGMAGTLAVAEESGSWVPEAIRATARRVDSGYALEGVKHYVFDAGTVSEIVVAARVGSGVGPAGVGPAGISLFVVPRQAVKVVPMANLDASRQYATVVLGGVEVGEDRLLGVPGHGEAALDRALQVATVALSAEMVGTCQAIFDTVHAHVTSREQFGVKIGSFQAIKHKLADMYVALESARALAYYAALAVAEDDPGQGLAVAMAKAAAGDCQRLIALEGIQCLGGIGYTWEHDMHLYVKRVKASAGMFGTAAEHRERVASLLGL